MNAKRSETDSFWKFLIFHNLFLKVYIMAPSAYKNKKQPLALTIAKYGGRIKHEIDVYEKAINLFIHSSCSF